jgi:hypothetical protein
VQLRAVGAANPEGFNHWCTEGIELKRSMMDGRAKLHRRGVEFTFFLPELLRISQNRGQVSMSKIIIPSMRMGILENNRHNVTFFGNSCIARRWVLK